MSIRNWFCLSFAVAAMCLCISPLPVSADEASRLVATAVQDEPRKIPEDNTAYFSRADRKVRFQLVKLAGAGSDMLAGTNVTVIDPTGSEIKLTADEQGIATLEDAKLGLHALVVAGDDGHSAIPLALRESDAPAAEDQALAAATPTVKLPLIDVDPKEVLQFTSSYLPTEITGTAEDVDNDFVASGEVASAFAYRVRLGDEGTLDGQVYSLLNEGLSLYGVAGTNLAFYRGNQIVARAIADDVGRFTVEDMVPGVYGLMAAGPAGYAAFAFEAYSAAAVAQTGDGETLVSVRDQEQSLTAANNMARGTILPVVLIPPYLLEYVLEQIRLGALGAPGFDGFAGAPGFGGVPFGGPGGFGPGVGQGFVGGGGFGAAPAGAAGGFGGLLGLGALGAIAAIAASENNDGGTFFAPASPATLSTIPSTSSSSSILLE